MKVLLFCLFLIPILVFGQEYKKIINTNTGEKILIGITSKKVYQDKDFSEWFNNEYTNYKVDTDLLSQYKDKLEGKVIRIVLGTWCSDSRREVPRFIKILDFLDFPEDKLLLINVDTEKKGLSDETEGLNIEFVPTIIVYSSGKEIGRIIETPIETLEKDLVNILKN